MPNGKQIITPKQAKLIVIAKLVSSGSVTGYQPLIRIACNHATGIDTAVTGIVKVFRQN